MSGASSPIRKINSAELKKYLSASKKSPRVIGAVEKHLMTRPLDTSRPYDTLHPSELIKSDWCARENYFRIVAARQGVYPTFERPGLRLQTVFDTGHAIHDRWQGYLAASGHLYGKWRCNACGWVSPPLEGHQDPCPMCGHPRFTYAEMHLFDDSVLISGHTDGWLVGLGADALLEIKSIGTGTVRSYDLPLLTRNDGNLEKAFGDIKGPFLDHRRQVQMYLRLAHSMYAEGKLNRLPPEEASILYECKANGAVKEFTVAYDPDSVEDCFLAGAGIVEALRTGVAPQCSVSRKGCPKCAPYKGE